MPESEADPIAIILVGAGGFGREILQQMQDVFAKDPQIRLKGFLDDNSAVLQAFDCSLPLIGSIQGYHIKPEDRFVITIGNPSIRTKIIREMEARGARFYTIIHPTAYVASSAKIGTGCIISPFCSIGSDAKLGDHVLMTWYSSLAHDAIAESYVVFSPYSTANGSVILEEGVFLGTHAVVNPMLRIGAWSKIASGSVVYHPVAPHCLAIGNPAKARPMLWKEAAKDPIPQ